MIRLLKALAAFALLGLLAGPMAEPAAAFAMTRAEEPIVLPFEPPLETPIRYRRTKQVVGSGRNVTIWSEVELVFSRRERGFRAEVRTIDGGMVDQPRAVQDVYRQVSADFERPYVLLLDETGLFVGLENEEAYWAETLRLTERVVRRGEGIDTAAERAMLQQLIGVFGDMPREARLAMLTEAVVPIFEFAATELALNVPISSPIEMATPFGGPATMQVEILADRVAHDHLFISVRGTMDRQSLLQAVERAFARLPITGRGENSEEGRARSMQQLREAEFGRDMTSSHEVELATGLTRRYRMVDRVRLRMAGEEGGRTTTVTIERLP